MTLRIVEDDEGTEYVLLKESAESSLVRDPETGERRHLPTESLDYVADLGPLEAAARRLSDPPPELLRTVPDDRTRGLLVELEGNGPTAARTLLGSYGLCESDLHGTLAELQAGGLIAETTVAGERGYEVTDRARELLDASAG